MMCSTCKLVMWKCLGVGGRVYWICVKCGCTVERTGVEE